jgi:hypothetical protein
VTSLTMPTTSTPNPSAPHWRWIYRPSTDLLLAFGWVPFYLVAHWLSAQRDYDHALRTTVTWTLVLSLVHQPLTLLLVYGDSSQRMLRRRLFAWTPVVAVTVVVIAVGLDLWLIVPVAAIWNTLHTVQQRYGICRVYGRKSGYGDARLDRLLLFSWLGTAILVAGALPSTTDQLGRVSLGSRNAQAVEALTRIRPYAVALLVPAGLIALAALALTVAQERRAGNDANPAKWLYLGGTLALIVGIATDPLAGLVAWIVAHTIEYLVIVQRTMASRYGSAASRTPLGVLARGGRRWWLLAGFLTLALGIDRGLVGHVPTDAYLTVIYTLGVLHFVYDAVIWKTRRPAVAADFGIRAR